MKKIKNDIVEIKKQKTLYDKICDVIEKNANYYIYSDETIGDYIHSNRIRSILIDSERSIKTLIKNEIKRQKA